MNRRSASNAIKFQGRYVSALRHHLARPRASIQAAGNLGRQAASAGLDTSALARIHKRALMKLLPPGDTLRTNTSRISRAAMFFITALEPMDQTRRAAAESNGRLTRLKESMRRNTAELAVAQRQLKSELARRKTLEAALEKSEKKHAQLLKQSLSTQECLRLLSRQILSAHEQERKRISRELHDEIGQTLIAINVKLATLKAEANINAKALKQTIRSTQRLVEQSMDTVHRFARDLRPPLLDDLGLIPALHSLLNAFTKQTDIPVRFVSFAAVEKLDGDRRTVLYRVAQEALANITKHARASLVIMNIRRNENLVAMEIRDNGKGFDVKRRMDATVVKRLGLLGMRERLEMVGGKFEIESEPHNGTTIRAQVPFASRVNSPRARRRVFKE